MVDNGNCDVSSACRSHDQHFCCMGIPKRGSGLPKLQCAHKPNHLAILLKNANYDSGSLGWGLRFCTENKLPGATVADGLQTTLSEQHLKTRNRRREDVPCDQESKVCAKRKRTLTWDLMPRIIRFASFVLGTK